MASSLRQLLWHAEAVASSLREFCSGYVIFSSTVWHWLWNAVAMASSLQLFCCGYGMQWLWHLLLENFGSGYGILSSTVLLWLWHAAALSSTILQRLWHATAMAFFLGYFLSGYGMQWLWHLLFEFSEWLWHLLFDNFYGMQWLWHRLFQNFAVAVAFSSIIWYGIFSSTILQWILACFELSPSVLDSLDVLLFCSSCKQEVAGATVDNGIWCADFVT